MHTGNVLALLLQRLLHSLLLGDLKGEQDNLAIAGLLREQANVELPDSSAQNVCDFLRSRLTQLSGNTHLLGHRGPHLRWLDCLKGPANDLATAAKEHLARGLINLLDYTFSTDD
jgi:hypothetical protein